MATALLEARPYRPFKSSEEYLYAMREDLAEWMNTLYPELLINVDNFMDRLDTGVALCKHANNVRQAAKEYIARRLARNKSMTRSMTSGLAGPILAMENVHYLPMAKSGTFFSRDNVSNFIAWCRKSLQIFECLLFETDDLIMRKNEKHVILCLLEVARRGAKFGMLAPMLVQMERQIDREIAADNRAMGISIGCGTDNDLGGISANNGDANGGSNTMSVGTEGDEMFESDSEEEDENNDPMMIYGPQPQIITNDLKSLDEMVRDLVEKCTCPSQFPMVRVSEGKYRIGDTKVLIFVRILRSHVMVRVGGGWDTLCHYLDKHDPCRCRAQHRTSNAAKLITRTNNNTNGGIELHKAQVIYNRSPPTTRKSAACATPTTSNNLAAPSSGRQRSRSPTPQPQKKLQNCEIVEKMHSPQLLRRSNSPAPKRIADYHKRKQNSLDSNASTLCGTPLQNEITTIPNEDVCKQVEGSTDAAATKSDNCSDNGSEISDEGYRSLGIMQNNNKRTSLHSEASNDEVDNFCRLENELSTCTESDLSPKTNDCSISSSETLSCAKELSPKSSSELIVCQTEDDTIADIASATGLRKTGFSNNLYDNDGNLKKPVSKIPRSPLPARRKSIDATNCSASTETGLSLNRKLPVYRSVRKLSRPDNTSPTTTPIISKKEGNRTWSSSTKSRTPITSNTYQSPNSVNFQRNASTRASSSNLYDKSGRKVKSSSVTTSPVKKSMSPSATTSTLAQEILQVAGNYKNDTAILEKMKELLHKYESDKCKSPQKQQQPSQQQSCQLQQSPQSQYEDFTTAWVNNSGSPDMIETVISPKVLSRGGSIVSSSECSTNSKDVANVVTPLRKDHRGCSKIPAPVKFSNPEIC